MNHQINLSQFSIPFQRGTKKSCQVCKSDFSFINREHVCKRCYRSVCQQCSPYKVRSYKADRQHRPHRMCLVCYKQSEYLHKYVKSNHLKWGQDCDLIRLWKKGFAINPIDRNFEGINQNKQRNFSQNINTTQKIHISHRSYKEFVEVGQLWKSLNYSFRQFIGIVLDQSKISEDDIVQNINTALSEICLRVNSRQNGFSKRAFKPECIVYVVMFFLSHATLSNTILLTLQVLNITDPYTCNQASRKQILQNIITLLTEVGCSDMQTYKIQSFLEQQNLEQYLDKLTLNLTTTQLSIQTISLLITKQSISQLQKSLAYVLNSRKEFICQNNSDRDAINRDIVRNLSCEGFRKFLKEVEHVMRSGSINLKRRADGKGNIRIQERESSQLQDGGTYMDSREGYKQLFKNNQELKILNKNQQEQITRLKKQIINLKKGRIQKQLGRIEENRDSIQQQIDDEQFQIYYQEEEYIDGYENIPLSPITHRISAVMSDRIQFTPIPDRGSRYNFGDETNQSPNFRRFIELNPTNYKTSYPFQQHPQQDSQSLISEEELKDEVTQRNSFHIKNPRQSTISQNRNSFLREGSALKTTDNSRVQQSEPVYQKRPIIKTRLVKKQRRKEGKKNTNSFFNNLKNNKQRHSAQSDKDIPNTSTTQESILTELLQKKNEQIGKLRKEMQRIKSDVKEVTVKYQQSVNKDNDYLEEKDIKIRKVQIEMGKISEENSDLKNMNRLLLLKLNQLSSMVMDREEKQLQMINLGKNQQKQAEPSRKGQKSNHIKDKQRQGHTQSISQNLQLTKNIPSDFLSKQEQDLVTKNILKLYMYQQYPEAEQCRLI